MKYTVTIDCKDEEELGIIKSAKTNYFILQGLYDSVFRPVIRYSEDAELVEKFETVWEKLMSI